MRITWLGHATVLFETAGARLLTDPILRPRIMHLRRHALRADPPEGVDSVLISHPHRDHFDVPSVRAVGAPVVAPPSVKGLDVPVRAARPGQAMDVGDARIVAVPAVHDGRRWPLTPHGEDGAVGYVIEAEGLRVYFAGDTELFDGMRDLGHLDLALLPIWGWGPSLGPGHMDPGEAAEALVRLRPAKAVPIHWGTFLPMGMHRSHGHLLRDPATAFSERAAEVAPDVQVELLPVGGSLVIAPRRP